VVQLLQYKVRSIAYTVSLKQVLTIRISTFSANNTALSNEKRKPHGDNTAPDVSLCLSP